MGTLDGSGSAWVRRVLLAIDVERYGRRLGGEQDAVQRHLLEIISSAYGGAGLTWARLSHPDAVGLGGGACVLNQDQGDGVLGLFPAGIDEPRVVAALVKGVAVGLRLHNRDRVERARLRLRMAIGQGVVRLGATGVPGRPAVEVCRLRDSGPARAALNAAPEVDLVVVLQADVFRAAVEDVNDELLVEDFRPAEVREKEFVGTAWLTVARGARFGPPGVFPASRGLHPDSSGGLDRAGGLRGMIAPGGLVPPDGLLANENEPGLWGV
jgi:hypothetical protein